MKLDQIHIKQGAPDNRVDAFEAKKAGADIKEKLVPFEEPCDMEALLKQIFQDSESCAEVLLLLLLMQEH